MADLMVQQVQEWLNETYGGKTGFNRIADEQLGKTGWPTIYALRRALQIELGLPTTSDSFGPSTYASCPNINQGAAGNLVNIVQGGLWCKGYNPGGFNGYYGPGTFASVKLFKEHAGFPTATGNMNRDIMRALLDMSAFVCVQGGTEEIRAIQQQLNYNYYDYYQVCPCDGLYNREMNKMLIYALQSEEGISSASATGSWGPTTISRCPTLSLGQANNYVKLVKYALVCNGYSIETSSNVYTAKLDELTQEFASQLKIEKQSSKIGYSVIRSLLSSNGDPDRAALACDTATKLTDAQIQTIRNEGYQFVGRYLSNTPGGTLNKALTRDEINRITAAGLKLFYIFQESNNSSEVFTNAKGKEQIERAIKAADSLGIPSKSIIYFAVDCDPQDAEITSNILPYFKAIKLFIDSLSIVQYRIGVYGTRNVCLRLKESIPEINLFVSDASYGFSGNLGFTMPSQWNFDQFSTDRTIGSGAGQVSIDKVGVSYRDNCDYGILVDVKNPEFETIYPTTSENIQQGVLMVNMNDNGLRVYGRIHYDPSDALFKGRFAGIPNDSDCIYTLPKYALYLNITKVKDDDYDNNSRCASQLIKFFDNNLNERYGYIVSSDKPTPGAWDYPPIPLTNQQYEDLAISQQQKYMTNYIVNGSHNALIETTKEYIDDIYCTIYSTKYSTQVYNADGSRNKAMPTIPANTKVAIYENTSGETHNNLIPIHRIKLTNAWVNVSDDTKANHVFIDYHLEMGCMPSNRLLNS